ncbi:MAG: M20 family metallopeptidase [Holophaga sp.]|nr:M20 family metallopeptidase [Holophaga sp.]
MRSIIESVKDLESALVADRRHLHANPEIGFALPDTVLYVSQRLREMGIPCRQIGLSGIVACLGKPGRTLLLRADMDALPMRENTDLPFRSQNGFGHCCGHDMHTAMLLGVAAVLKEHEAELEGTVKLLFQPAEEIGTGAKAMILAGVLDDPKVDAALAGHVASLVPTGTVLWPKGIALASMDTFMVRVQGKGGHSSMPHLCVDPLLIVNTMYMMLNSLVGKLVDPFETAVLTVGKVGGGTAPNVIPDTAVLEGGLRCYSKEARTNVMAKVNDIIEYVPRILGGTCTKETTYTPILHNDAALGEAMAGAVRDVVGAEQFVIMEQALPGTEDFAYFSEEVPSMYLVIGAGSEASFPLHNPSVVLDEKALVIGASVYAHCAAQWLKQ